ncbi:MAG: VCBS repeat-containing protein [Candidatus Dormibacter sp.]
MRRQTILATGAFAILVGLALPSRSAVAANHPTSAASSSFGAPTKWSSTPFLGSQATLGGDVNHDGSADLVAVNNSSTLVMLSNGSSFGAPTRWSSTPFFGNVATLLADVNHDGNADLVAVNNDGTWVMTSNGSSFGSPREWSSSPFFGSKTTLLGDVNHDGNADLVAVNGDSTWVMLSNGSSFGAPTKWSSTPFLGNVATLLADVNNDGNADLVAVNHDSTWVMTSNGSSFAAPAVWSSNPFFGSKATLLDDVNSDGNADLVAVNNDSTWVMLSTGAAAALAVQQTDAAANASAGTSFTLGGITATAAHQLLVADIIMRTAAPPSTAVATFTDNAGNTWHKAVADNPAGVAMSGEIWYAFNATGGVTSVTATTAASSGIIIRFYEINGATTTDPLDKVVTATGASTAPNSGATAATSQASEVAIGSIGWATSVTTISALTGGFTTDATVVNTSAGVDSNEQDGHQVTSATGTLDFAGTLSASHAWVASIATFK